MNSLLSELLQRVQELYDSVPGSSTQREADQWLTSFVNVEGAWEVLLHVLSNAAAQQQQPQQSQATDVRLLFISAKILQVGREDHMESTTGVSGSMPLKAYLPPQDTPQPLLLFPSHNRKLKIQRDWCKCSPETRQGVQQCLSSHLQHEALG